MNDENTTNNSQLTSLVRKAIANGLPVLIYKCVFDSAKSKKLQDFK